MKQYQLPWAAIFLLLFIVNTQAAVRHVDLNSPSPAPPYADWNTAATNIQDAIDAATDGDVVLVTNGIYSTGGRVVYGSLTNRVAVTKALSVQSVNGPAVTIIQGYQDTNTINGDDAVRCVYLTNGAALTGFTLTNGATLIDPDEARDYTLYTGGGLYCESTNVVASNCVITGCSANDTGGGAENATLNGCLLTSNQCIASAGADRCVLSNCVLNGNVSGYGGGAGLSTLINCTLTTNSATASGLGIGGGVFSCTLTGCTLIGNSSDNGGGAFGNSDNPCSLTNCTLTGNSASYSGAGAAGCTLINCVLSNNVVPFGFDGATLSPYGSGGGAQSSVLINCLVISNYAGDAGGGADGGLLTNCVLVGNSVNDSGGAAALATLIGCTITNNFAGYGGGATEACGLNGCTITGNSSFYGGGATDSTLTNCTLAANSGNLGGGALNSTLMGCTLSNNSTYDSEVLGTGGGAASCTLDNCLLTGNSSSLGGGADGGTLTNCTLTGNSATSMGGGANGSTLNNCTLSGNYASDSNGDQYGGGAENCVLSGCVLTGNYTRNYGGAADASTLSQCLITNNWTIWGVGGGIYASGADDCVFINNSANAGGGAEGSSLTNCTLTGNNCDEGEGEFGGGADGCNLYNCILYFNNGNNDNYNNSTLNYCCTTPLPGGAGNFTAAPLFVDLAGGDLHLQANSPCINAGNNSFVSSASDLDGEPRIVGGTVDAGAYEFQSPASALSYAWAQQYGLPTDGSVDLIDSDGDGMNNLQESIAGTNPTNALSVLKMLSSTATNGSSGVLVSWQSVNNRTYYLQRSSNPGLPPAFSTIQSNIAGLAGATRFVDASATNGGPYFYRVGVQ